MEKTKICTGCKEEKTLDNFYNHKTAKHKKNPKCKKCKNKIGYEYAKTDKHKQYIKQYDKINRERKNNYTSKWLKKTTEELSNFYIERQIQKIVKIPRELIPKELIELKRIQLKTYRLCQQLQN